MLTEKVLACLSTSKQTKLPLQQLRTYSNFPHPPQLWHFCLWGKSSSALCSSPLLSVCVTSPKYSLSYWRPVQPVLCPSDVFTTLCPTPPHLSFCQGNFCLLRHSSLLLPHPNPTPTPSADIYKLSPIQLLDLILSWLPNMTHNVFLTPFRLDLNVFNSLNKKVYHRDPS